MRDRRSGKHNSRVPVSVAALVAVLPLVLAAAPARASADIDCYPDVRLRHASFTRCNLMSALGPGNDTRANLLLLLLDRDGEPPRAPPAPPLPGDAVPLFFWSDFRDRFVALQTVSTPNYADGEGSRCLSNDTGTAAFVAAVTAAADVSADDRADLIGTRRSLQPTCKEGGGGIASFGAQHSATAKAFSTYLDGIETFYAGTFDAAGAAFGDLHGSADPWLADTADYMVARTLVNQLQVGGFDDYGDRPTPKAADQVAADRATASLEAYLHEHPGGRYVASARGLERRVDWLAGRKDALAASYAAVLALPLAQRGLDDATLAEEIADKLLLGAKPATTHDPLLLATLDLAAMRAPDDDPDKPAKAQHVDLEAQRADFAAALPLFEFLVATQAYYVDHDPAKVVGLVPDETHRRDGDHLWFSRQVLRGLALEAKGDRNARGFWTELFAAASRPLDGLTVQLGLAIHDERARALDDVFAPGSIVTSPRIRRVLLENDADAALLRRQARDQAVPASEREIALATLLWKQVTRGHYAEFVADVGLVPNGAPIVQSDAAGAPLPLDLFTRVEPGELGCPTLAATAAQLDHDPRAVRPRLCIAEFVRLGEASYDVASENDYVRYVGTRPPLGDLGGGPSMFPGTPYDRASTYKAVIADKAAPAADRAYALYRAVLCWAPSGVNECGGPDVPKVQREAWYKALKRDYPTSHFAKELAYWW